MAAGSAIPSKGKGEDYSGRMTIYVVLSCMVAAMGGIIFGYDIGISGPFPQHYNIFHQVLPFSFLYI